MPAKLDALPVPSAPVTEAWTLTISTLLGRWDRIPPQAMRLLSVLDRVGSIRLTREGVGFDDRDVEWSKIKEVRLLPVSHSLSKAALHHELERLSRLMPAIPGRRKLLMKIGEGLTDLAVAAFNRGTHDHLAVSALVYSGTFGRTREMPAGVFVTSILGALAPVNDSVVVTAQTHGAQVFSS